MLNHTKLLGMVLVIQVVLLPFEVGAVDSDANESDVNTKHIEKITVTSYRREAFIRDLSTSITAITNEQIEQQGIDNLQGILRTVPGAKISQPRRNRGTISIRGINTDIGETQLTQDPVGLHLNAMPITGSYAEILQPDLSLYDINRVEVLRGPQGTLYGSGNIGGTVRIITNKPQLDQVDAAVRLDFADIAGGGLRQRQDAMLNIPLITEELALRVVASHRDEQGWIKNIRLDIDNSYSEVNLRAVLRWQPSDDLQFLLEAMWVDSEPEDADSWNPNAGKFQRSSYISEARPYDMQIFNFTVEYQLSEAFNLVSSTNKRSSSANWFEGLGPFGDIGQLVNQSFLDVDIFSQEVRLVSSPQYEVKWVAGLYYQDYEVSGPSQFNILGLADFFDQFAPGVVESDIFFEGSFPTKVIEKSVFADIEFPIVENWSLALGLRYFDSDASVEQRGQLTFDFDQLALVSVPNFTNQVDDSGLMWRSALSYKPDNSQHYYLSISKGMRAAQVNPSFGPSPADPNDIIIEPSYQPDTLYNSELGAKLSWFEESLQTNIALYLLSWENIQVDALRQSDNRNYIANAGDASAIGVEIELRAKPSNHWEFYLAAALQDFEIDNITNQQAFASGAQKGDALPGAADLTFSAGLLGQWQLNSGIEISAAIDINYVDESTNRFSFQTGTGMPNPDFAINDAYSQINARLSVDYENWTGTFYVENLTNNDDVILNVGATRTDYAISLKPRTAGIRLNYDF